MNFGTSLFFTSSQKSPDQLMSSTPIFTLTVAKINTKNAKPHA